MVVEVPFCTNIEIITIISKARDDMLCGHPLRLGKPCSLLSYRSNKLWTSQVKVHVMLLSNKYLILVNDDRCLAVV